MLPDLTKLDFEPDTPVRWCQILVVARSVPEWRSDSLVRLASMWLPRRFRIGIQGVLVRDGEFTVQQDYCVPLLVKDGTIVVNREAREGIDPCPATMAEDLALRHELQPYLPRLLAMVPTLIRVGPDGCWRWIAMAWNPGLDGEHLVGRERPTRRGRPPALPWASGTSRPGSCFDLGRIYRDLLRRLQPDWSARLTLARDASAALEAAGFTSPLRNRAAQQVELDLAVGRDVSRDLVDLVRELRLPPYTDLTEEVPSWLLDPDGVECAGEPHDYGG